MKGETMKIKNGYMSDVMESLMKFQEQTGKTGYAIMRNIRILQPNLEDFEKVRLNLFKKYGTTNDDGNNYSVSKESENYDEFIKEYEELLNIEADIELYQIDASDVKLQCADNASVKDYMIVSQLISKAET